MSKCYKSYDELPLFLKANDVAKTLNVSLQNAYVIINRDDFPKFKIGKRIMICRARFFNWLFVLSKRQY